MSQLALIETVAERFARFISPEPNSGCWLWTGFAQPKPHNLGYGKFNVGGSIEQAHRVAWAIAHSQWAPRALVVMHRCDNTLCVNPDHLRLGTQAENIADRVAKGRSARGDNNGRRVYLRRVRGVA